MDHADALRLVVFEYLLPEMRRQRARVFLASVAKAQIGPWFTEHSVGGLMHRLLLLSDRLLALHGHATSFTLPLTTKYTSMSPTVDALVDGDGPWRWTGGADPFYGVCVFAVPFFVRTPRRTP